jgi:hypothetical protein
MRKILLLILIFITCIAHNKYFVHVTKDDFDNSTQYLLKDNILSAEDKQEAHSNKIDLRIERFDSPDTIIFNLMIVYSGSDYMFIRPGESLVFLVDGKRFGFSGSGGELSPKGSKPGVVSESACYDVTAEFLKKMIFAKYVWIKIKGDRFDLERFITESLFEKYRRFYREYVQ